MSRLILADVPRILKSRIFYLVLILTAFMGVTSVLTALSVCDDKSMILTGASNSFVMFMAIMMPVFSGGLSIILIASEFSSGIIRNKFIMGHRRTDIFFSWGMIYTLFTILNYVLYVAAFFAVLKVTGADLSGVDHGNVFMNLFIFLLLMIKFQMFSLLLISIYPDVKSTLIVYILNNITIIPMITLSMYDENSKALKFLSKIFIYGYTDTFRLTSKPDKPWITVLSIALLSLVYMILALLHFDRKDLK